MDSPTAAIDPVLMRAKARVGRTLRGKWHLDVLLGVGGMAAVYAGTHRNGSRAAIKILHPELSADSHIRSRFFREGRVANTIAHDGAVKVLDEDEDESGSIFLVMELLDGESLDSRVARAGGKLPVDEVLAAADQLLDVLVDAHAKGVIHRDLKPENVFLTRDGQVKVLDFGIARLRKLSSHSQATRDGSTMGTPAFMAPEQARGLWDEVDARADLWAVGATMFALLTGRPVHQGRTTNEVLVAAVTQKAAPLADILDGVPEPVAALVDRALAFDKSERWADAQAMQDALRHAFHSMHGAPISTHPKLTVPEVVPNRTLPSAGMSLPPTLESEGTGPAVASGRTGVPLRSSALGMPPAAWIAALIAAVGALAAIVIVLTSLVSSHTAGRAAETARPNTSLMTTGSEPEAPPDDADAGRADGSTAESPAAKKPAGGVISVDELPVVESPEAKPVRSPVIKPRPKAPATSWKDQRR